MEDSSIFTQHSFQPDDVLWPRANVSAFVGFMYDEVVKGNAVGHKFSPSQWYELAAKMNTTFPCCNYTIKQLQGKSDRLKGKWKKYHNLLLSDTGFGWDDVNNMVTASAETWDRHLATHPSDKHLRKKGLAHYRELTTIYAPTTATGNMARASTQGRVAGMGRGCGGDFVPQAFNSTDGAGVDVGQEEASGHATGYASSMFRQSTSGSHAEHLRKKPQEPAVISAMQSFTKANEAIAALAEHARTEVEVCIDKLNEIPDLPDYLFSAACTKLEDPTRRRMFLAMPACRRRSYIENLP